MPAATQQYASVADEIVRSGSHTRDSRRSSLGWESRQDGQLVKRDYYQMREPTMAPTNSERGLHILGNIFTGNYALAMNETWLREKNIQRVLVLGTGSGISVRDTLKLRVVDISEGPLDLYFDSIATLITESSNDNANVLIVDRDNRTFNPSIIVAHLLSAGWLLDAAVSRVEGIYRVILNHQQMGCLRRWEETLKSRREEMKSCEARSRTNSAQSVTNMMMPTIAPSVVSTMSSTSLPAFSAISVINPAYNAIATRSISTFAAPLLPAPILSTPAISAVSVVNPYWSTTMSAPLISAQSVINPYWNSFVTAAPVFTETVVSAPLVAAPIVHPIIQPIISAGPAISAVSLVNPYWNEQVVQRTSVINPMYQQRHSRTEYSGRIEAPAPAWNVSRSLQLTSSEFDTSSNPLARFPRSMEVSRHSSGDAALANTVETTAMRRALQLQRGPSSAYEPEVNHHYVRDITSFG